MKKLMSRLNAKKNNKGFTLVELIIVVAIIAVLAAVLAPQYVKYVERSRQGVDASTVQEIKHNVEIEAGITENLTAGSVTITGSTGVIAATGTNLSIANVQSVVGTTAPFKSTISKGYTYTMTISAAGVVEWDAATTALIAKLQAGTATAAS